MQSKSFVLQHLQQLERCRKIRVGCFKTVSTVKGFKLLRQAPSKILMSHQSIYMGCLNQQCEVFTRRQRMPGCFSNEIFNMHKTEVVCNVLFQMLFCGSQHCFENYETARYYGSSVISHSTCKAIHHNVIPLLKSMVQMLEEDSRSYITSETPGKREVKGTVSYLILLWPLKTLEPFNFKRLEREILPSGSWNFSCQILQ